MATPRKTASKAKKDPAALSRKTAREALDRATGTIRRLQKDATRNAWQIGRQLAQVVELELHQARGYANLQAYAEKEAGLSGPVAFQYMRIAQAFSQEVAATWGTEKLDRALRYIAATPEDEQPGDIPTLKVRVPGEDGVRELPFAQATVADLRAATQAERGKKQPSRTKTVALTAEQLAGILAAANRALDQAVGRAAAKGAEVSLPRRDGRTVVELRGVPIEVAPSALRALASALRVGGRKSG